LHKIEFLLVAFADAPSSARPSALPQISTSLIDYCTLSHGSAEVAIKLWGPGNGFAPSRAAGRSFSSVCGMHAAVVGFSHRDPPLDWISELPLRVDRHH
jgi:hypothetical protein